ncbi:Organic cation transporter protein [Nymphon striatum]|nr:Organic cation transporter protein [Nymphon striatum]
MNVEGDADYDIVQAAIALSEYKTATLIREDTDLLIFLLHHMDSHKKTLYFRSDKKSKEQRVYNINTLKECLGQQLCSQLLFIHAFTGCDTTSRVFGMGKKPFFQKVAKGDEQLKSCAFAFTKPGQTADTIEQHGNQSMVLLFSGKQTDYLASLRHSVFKKKVVSASSFVAPARLPPTASATKFHSLRAYYQIMTWLGLESNLDATDWGWTIEDNQFAPVMTAKNHAPDNLFFDSLIAYSIALGTKEMNGSMYVNFALVATGDLLAIVALTFAIKYFRRVLFMSACMFSVAFVSFCQLAIAPEASMAIGGLALCGRFLITLTFNMTYAFTAELFPTPVRSSALGTGSMFSRVGGILAPYVATLIQIWRPLPVLILGSCGIVGGIVLLFLPETFNKELPSTVEEIENSAKIQSLPIKLMHKLFLSSSQKERPIVLKSVSKTI